MPQKLTLTPHQLYQSFAMNRCQDRGILTPENKLKHFGVKTLITSIAVDNERRADLVVKCTGIKRNSALRQSIEDSVRAIELALEVGDTNAIEIFDENSSPSGISTNEIAKCMPGDEVFDFWFNAGWTAGVEEDKAFVADNWAFIIEHKLLGETTCLEIVLELGISYFMSDKIPHKMRTSVLEAVFLCGEPLTRKATPDSSSTTSGGSKAFTAAKLLEVITPTMLVEYVELSDMARPIMALAKGQHWLKKEVIETPGESVPPPPAADGSKPLTRREKRAAERAARATVEEPETEVSALAADASDDDVSDDDAAEG